MKLHKYLLSLLLAFFVTVDAHAQAHSIKIDAGPDQEIAIADTASLAGTMTAINVTPTVTWRETDGPAFAPTVTFGNIHSLETSASFSYIGTYVLTLTATATKPKITAKASSITIVVKNTVKAPSAVVVTNVASNQLVWEPVSGIAGYNLYRSTTSGVFMGGPINGGTLIGQTSYTDNSVVMGNTYYYVVRAVDASNVESANSNQITLTW